MFSLHDSMQIFERGRCLCMQIIRQGTQTEGLGSPLTVRGLLPTLGAVMLLSDSTSYVLCVAAQDTTTFRNVQREVKVLPFTTKDVTPPRITAVLDSVACDRYEPSRMPTPTFQNTMLS